MLRALALCFFLSFEAGSAWANLNIQFDYTYDSGNFFSASRRTLLNSAAQTFSSFTDSLSAITPVGGNTWSAIFDNPSTGAALSLSNLGIGANTILVFVGAQNLGAGILGEGGPGGFSDSGTTSWLNTVKARGQAGALTATPTDFGPWGGAISFSSTAAWYFDPDPSTAEPFAGQNDFFSVAVHELGHLLGVGTAGAWNAKVSGTHTFTGTHAVAANGGQVPLSGAADGDAHWADGTTSTIPGTSTVQEAVMDPSLTVGSRKYFTTLDYAGLQDVGWQVVPEPASWLLVCAGALTLARRGRRRL